MRPSGVPVGVRVEEAGELPDRVHQRLGVGPVRLLLEHHVLDEVRDAGLAVRILARADLVAHVDLDQRRGLVGHDHEAQAVGGQRPALLAVDERGLGDLGVARDERGRGDERRGEKSGELHGRGSSWKSRRLQGHRHWLPRCVDASLGPPMSRDVPAGDQT
jgi:hypothetical protein